MSDPHLSILESSGILTHLKVADCLKRHGWSLTISSYYYDDVANLVKEIDIVAEKQFNSYEEAPGLSSRQLNIQLFIECKYINQEVSIWFDQMNRKRALSTLEEEIGMVIAEHHSGDILPEELHYLCAGKVVKLYSTNSNKEDLIYKAISQCLRALVYYKQWADAPISRKFNDHVEVQTKIIRYPVVVCGNFENIKEVEVDSETDKYSVKDLSEAFLLETNYVHLNKEKTAAQDNYFLVDFINVTHLNSFLETINKEGRSLIKAMSFLSDR